MGNLRSRVFLFAVVFAAASVSFAASTDQDFENAKKIAQGMTDEMNAAVLRIANGRKLSEVKPQELLDDPQFFRAWSTAKSQPIAVQYINQNAGNNLLDKLSQVDSHVQAKTEANMKKAVADKWNQKVEEWNRTAPPDKQMKTITEADVTMEKPTNYKPTEIKNPDGTVTKPRSKLGQDLDITPQVHGQDIPESMIGKTALESTVHKSYYDAAGGDAKFKNPEYAGSAAKGANPESVAAAHSIEVTNAKSLESYKEKGKILGENGNAPDTKRLYTEGQDYGNVFEYKTTHAKESYNGVQGDYEQIRTASKQIEKHVNPRIQDQGGKVNEHLAECQKVLKDGADMKLSPEQVRSKLAEMGETVDSVINKSSGQLEALEKRNPIAAAEERKLYAAETKAELEAKAKGVDAEKPKGVNTEKVKGVDGPKAKTGDIEKPKGVDMEKVKGAAGKALDVADKAMTVIGLGSDLNKIVDGYVLDDTEKMKEGAKEFMKDAVSEIPGVGSVITLANTADMVSGAAADHADFRFEMENLDANAGKTQLRQDITVDLYKMQVQNRIEQNGSCSQEERAQIRAEVDKLAAKYELGDEGAKAAVEDAYKQLGKEVPKRVTVDRTLGKALEDYAENVKDNTIGMVEGIAQQAIDTFELGKTAVTGRSSKELKPGESAQEVQQKEQMYEKLKEYGMTEEAARQYADDRYSTDQNKRLDAELVINDFIKDIQENRKAEAEAKAKEEEEKKAAEKEAALEKLKEKLEEKKKELEEAEKKKEEAEKAEADGGEADKDEDKEGEDEGKASEGDDESAAGLRDEEGGTLPEPGNDGSIADEGSGGSLGGFTQDREAERAADTAADKTFGDLNSGARQQEGWNLQIEMESRRVLEEGGTAANDTGTKSAASTAAAQDANSWGTAISDGIQQGITAGLTALGSSFGGALGDKIGEDVASSVFGDPDHKNLLDDDWQPKAESVPVKGTQSTGNIYDDDWSPKAESSDTAVDSSSSENGDDSSGADAGSTEGTKSGDAASSSSGSSSSGSSPTATSGGGAPSGTSGKKPCDCKKDGSSSGGASSGGSTSGGNKGSQDSGKIKLDPNKIVSSALDSINNANKKAQEDALAAAKAALANQPQKKYRKCRKCGKEGPDVGSCPVAGGDYCTGCHYIAHPEPKTPANSVANPFKDDDFYCPGWSSSL